MSNLPEFNKKLLIDKEIIESIENMLKTQNYKFKKILSKLKNI